ncbi:XylR N-terminal domain-containing protein [Virgibacillus xinjiangensis]|uniref:XylR N-terminal domain-containing protein n=1 Tax=Virgibacillus xinjiangensis TaxID=393090 RepID=A0ABV7CSS2_9BACI
MVVEHKLRDGLQIMEDGTIHFDGDRSILTSISAFGTLRKDLLENIGQKRVKGFLIRYGEELGRHDARKMKDRKGASLEKLAEYGPVLHTMQGHVQSIPEKIEVIRPDGNEKASVHMEGIWEKSYEAVEHVRQFGCSPTPVCYTLTGYASGYLSEIFDRPIIFKEVSCYGAGDSHCRWVGKSLDLWDGEVDDELPFYQESPIVKELEVTYERLLEERNNFAKTYTVHKKLTNELLRRRDLHSIAHVVNEYMDVPILIEDAKLSVLAQEGFTEEELEAACEDFRCYMDHPMRQKNPINHTKLLKLDNHTRLVTPIYLQDDIIGYCSFCGEEGAVSESNSNAHRMIIEQISSVSSLYLLNEKTEIEAAERVKGRFLEEILSGKYQPNEILRRSNYFQVDLHQPFKIMAVKCSTSKEPLEEELLFYEDLLETTLQYFKRNQLKILISQYTNRITLLIPEQGDGEKDIDTLCRDYFQFLTEEYPEATFSAGMSLPSDQIGQAVDSYREALTALRMATRKNKIIHFDRLGLMGPLINANNEQEVKRIASYILGPLCEDMNHKKLELLKTLHIFLSNGGNLEQTAADIALSLSGLRYRLGKIEEMLEMDLRNPTTNHQLLLSLQALILIGEIELD